MFHHRYRYGFILLLSCYTFLNTVLCDVYYYFQIGINWYYSLLAIFLVTALTWEGNRFLEKLFINNLRKTSKRIRSILLFFLAGNIVAVTAAFLAVFFVGIVLNKYSWEQNINPLKLNVIYAILVNLFFHLLNTILYFFNEYRKHWMELEELRKSQSQAQLQLIKNQINPHFLFNNLNVLSGMVIKDNPEANEFIEEFSKVYRYILNTREKELVELSSELDFVKPYLFLLNKRFADGLWVNINIPGKYYNSYVIPACLQMLIENAIKHNIVSGSKPLVIEIYIKSDDTLVVSNNLQLRKTREYSSNLGLTNIQKRYELIAGKDIIVENDNHSFRVTVPLIYLN